MVDSVRDLHSQHSRWQIWVKVITKWTKMDHIDNNIEIIFSDLFGDKIQATIPVNLIDQFSDRLSVGTWKYLSHFEVHTETRTIRNTKHKFRIFFNSETMVRPSHKTCNNQFYDFESFESVLNHNFNGINHSIDLFGQIDSVEPLITYDNDPYEELFGEKVRIIKFILRDRNGWQLDCVAMDEIADKLNEKWHSQRSDVLTAVLRFWRVTYKAGFPEITTCNKVSQLLFDSQITEIDELKLAISQKIEENVSESDEQTCFADVSQSDEETCSSDISESDEECYDDYEDETNNDDHL